MGGAKTMSEYMIEARNALAPVIERLRQMEAAGTMPAELAPMAPAQRIYTLHRQMQQQKYGPTIAWFNKQIEKLQPAHGWPCDSTLSLFSSPTGNAGSGPLRRNHFASFSTRTFSSASCFACSVARAS